MSSHIPCSAGLFLLLLLIQGQGGAKPLAELQTLSQLLEEDPEQPTASEGSEPEQVKGLMTGALDQQDLLFPWAKSPWEEGPFQRFLSDLLSSARRLRGGRRKKGLLRGCFGVKLDRIGAFSGLGC